MKQLLSIFLYIACILAIVSCEDIIDVELNSVEPRLVIEGVVRMDSPAEVRVSYTQDFNNNTSYTLVKDAVVTISDDTGNSEVLTYDNSGRFIATTIRGIERVNYHLTVVHEGKEYTATSVMPPRVEIDSLTLWKFPVSDFYEPMVHFKDPVGEENRYYRFNIAINGEYPLLHDNLLSTEFMDGYDIHYPLFVRYTGSNDDDPIENGDEIEVEMRCLDKATYTFFETLSDMDNALANPTGNISGDALGYFGAYSFTRQTILMEWD